MREAHIRYLLAAALVAVAGYGVYSAAPQPADPSPAASAATTTQTPVPTTTEPPEQLAPGLTSDGVTDALALADAHTNQLRNTSYTVVTAGTTWDGNRSIYWRIDSYARVGAGGSPVLFVWNTTGVPPDARALRADIAIWHNDTHSFTRHVDANGTVTYHHSTPERDMFGGTPGRGAFVRSLFGAVNTTVVERIERNDTTLFRVVSTAQPRSMRYDPSRSNYSLSALVDSSGLVRRYHVSYDVREDGRTRHVTRSWRLSSVGSTTVGEPPWFETAKNATRNRGG